MNNAHNIVVRSPYLKSVYLYCCQIIHDMILLVKIWFNGNKVFLNLIEVMLHTVDLNQLTITNKLTCKLLSLVGVGDWDVLRGFKADLSLEKLKLV